MAKRKKAADAGECTPEEQARRKMQRELQALAVKLKSQGGVYKPQKHKRKVFKEHQIETGTFVKGKGKEKKKKEKKSKHDTPKWRPLNKTDVVILPIYWNMHHEEKAQVLSACEKVAGLLQEAGISCTTDAANQYTPGQKMKYWETAGVRVRVELGPKDAQAGTAVVARAGEPGTVAAKTTVNVTVQLVKEVQRALQEMGVPVGNKQGKQQGSTSLAEPSESQEASPSDEQSQQEEDDSGNVSEQAGTDEQGRSEGTADEDGSSGSGSDDEGVGKAAAPGTTLSRKQARKEKKRQAAAAAVAAAKAQAPAAGNIQSGSRRDRKRRAKLAALGKEDADGAERTDMQLEEAAEVVDEQAAGKKKQKQDKQSEAALEVEAGDASPQPANGTHGQGDDLADDFEIDPAFLPEPEEEALLLTKEQRLKKQKKTEKARRKQQRFGSGKAWDATEEEEQGQQQQPAASSKGTQKTSRPQGPKVVVF